MKKIAYSLAGLTVLVACLLFAPPAFAETGLVEFEGSPFSVAVHRKMAVEVVPHTGQAGFAALSVLPQNLAMMDLIAVSWPKDKSRQCILTVAIEAAGTTREGYPAMGRTYLTAGIGENTPVRIQLPEEIEGTTARICVWPTKVSGEADLVFLVSFVTQWMDCPVIGFTVSPDGSVRMVDTTNAYTLYAWFDVRDLDNDGRYELIASRNLDGTPGGFFYHSIRSYDSATGSYIADPGSYMDYFKAELAWLDWVVATKSKIEASPQDYMNATGAGPAYCSEYNGIQYGFDSIIELPGGGFGAGDTTAYNRERREAFRLIRDYRNELSDWINGGAFPATWKLSQ